MELWEHIRYDPVHGAKALMDGYGVRLFKTAYRLCSNTATAEDLAARTIAQAVHRIDQYVADTSFFGWLCAILVNFYRMDLRRKGANVLVFTDELPEKEDERADPAEILEAETDAKAIRAAVEQLSPALREAVILRYFNEFPEAEIARALGTSVGAVKVRLHAARRKLKEILSLTLYG
ncbi:MAG: RNA polymerase sigma factor [Kiritimatiellae bacterium]|nr:RNA polymerase sigma factor [Kiritimatiellia bacterium]